MKTPSNGKAARSNGKAVRAKSGRRASAKQLPTTLPSNLPSKPSKLSMKMQLPAKLQLPILNNAKPSGSFDCAQCGLCCTYVAIEIDGPSTVKRATELLWYLYHNGVSLYLNDDSWMVQFETTCRYLTADRRCGVYATRPHICREFSEQDCEVNTGDDGQTFYDATSFMAYLKQSKPRVYALVMKGYAPPEETKRAVTPFERRLRDVYVRRAAALSQPEPEFVTSGQRAASSQPRAADLPAGRTALPVKKSRGNGTRPHAPHAPHVPTDTL